ncbi:MAG: hypothetical protein Q9195_000248 [Heterodermia aff. obscurata]
MGDTTRTASDQDYEINDPYDDRLTGTHLHQRGKVLSGKITNVLSVSYADTEIRDALRALESTNVYNSPDIRRRLHLEVQKEVIDCNGEIIDQFATVAERLRRVGHTISRLNICCDSMHQQLIAAHRENAPILEETSMLLTQRQESETKKQLLEAFNQHFIMSEDELRVLTANPDIVDDSFFETLARVKRIHKDCQVLLGTENQRLGLELMEQSSRNLNSAYQKLYWWVQREFKLLDFENPQVSSTIRRALKALAERPTLFESCLDFFAEARQHALVDTFYSALTGSDNNSDGDGATKPIEYHSHDPLRYVGDMLAWTHAASVSEQEALENLAMVDGDDISRGIRKGTASEPWSGIDSEVFDGRKALKGLVGRNLTSVVQVLRQRVEQVIHNQEDPVLTYKFVNLLYFYRVTFTKLLGSEMILLENLGALEEFAFNHFQTLMMENVRFVQADNGRTPPDFRPPGFLIESLDHLKMLIKSFDASLTPIPSREKDFERVMGIALDPFLDVCRKISQGCEEPFYSTFLINCLQATQATLSGHDFLQQKVVQLEDDIRSYTTHLIEFQHSFFLHNSGLYPMIASLAPLSEKQADIVQSLRTLPIFQPAALRVASQTIDDFLPSALMDAEENLKYLHNRQMASNITAEAAEKFCEDFEFIEGQLAAFDQSDAIAKSDQEDPGSNKATEPLRQVFPRTSGEIRVLLS